MDNRDLPPKAGLSCLSPVGTHSPSAHAHREQSAKNTSARRRYRAAPRPLSVQRLAAELVAGCHGLHRGHIGGICEAITAAGIDPAVWSARGITDALNTDMKTRGWSWPDRIERPGAFLASRGIDTCCLIVFIPDVQHVVAIGVWPPSLTEIRSNHRSLLHLGPPKPGITSSARVLAVDEDNGFAAPMSVLIHLLNAEHVQTVSGGVAVETSPGLSRRRVALVLRKPAKHATRGYSTLRAARQQP